MISTILVIFHYKLTCLVIIHLPIFRCISLIYHNFFLLFKEFFNRIDRFHICIYLPFNIGRIYLVDTPSFYVFSQTNFKSNCQIESGYFQIGVQNKLKKNCSQIPCAFQNKHKKDTPDRRDNF